MSGGKSKKEFRFPSGEIVWMQYRDAAGVLTHFLTSKPDRSQYYIYAVTGDTYKRLGRGRSPPDLETKYLKP